MKKQLGFTSGILIIGIISVISAYHDYKTSAPSMSELQLKNIEALSRAENDPNRLYGFEMTDCMEKREGFKADVLVGQKCTRSSYEKDCDSNRQWGKCPNENY